MASSVALRTDALATPHIPTADRANTDSTGLTTILPPDRVETVPTADLNGRYHRRWLFSQIR